MLPRRTVTKKQKKEASKKKLGLVLVFLGLIAIVICLFFTAFIEKPGPILNPLSKNQITSTKQVESVLQKENIKYKSLTTEKDLNYKVILENNGEVIIDPNKDILKQVSSLQLILSQLKIDNKAFKRLDFRYEKPVIAF